MNFSKSLSFFRLNQVKEPNFTFEDDQTVWRALNGYRGAQAVKIGTKKKIVDFADVPILEKPEYDIARKK